MKLTTENIDQLPFYAETGNGDNNLAQPKPSARREPNRADIHQVHQQIESLVGEKDPIVEASQIKTIAKQAGVSSAVVKKVLKTERAKRRSSADVATPSLLAQEEAARLSLGDIFKEFHEDYRDVGYVADRPFSDSILITHGARLLPNSTGFILYGASGSGKTESLECGAAFLPPEDVMHVTAASDTALFYMGDIRRKYLLYGEISPPKPGEDDPRQMALRQLISENKLVRLSVDRSEGGKNESVRLETEGPCVFSAATTTEQTAWHDEFVNRLSWIRTDDSDEATKQVCEAIALRAEAPWLNPDKRPIHEKWHAFHRSLQPLPVGVPFAKLIKPTLSHVTARRLYNLVLMYVKVSALLHQQQREKIVHRGTTYLVAQLDDYAVAYRLLLENAPRVLDAVSPRAKEALERIPDFRNRHLTTGEIVTILRLPKTTVQRLLSELESAGSITRGDKSGRQNTYKAVDKAEAVSVSLGLIDPKTILTTDGLDDFVDEEAPF